MGIIYPKEAEEPKIATNNNEDEPESKNQDSEKGKEWTNECIKIDDSPLFIKTVWWRQNKHDKQGKEIETQETALKWMTFHVSKAVQISE